MLEIAQTCIEFPEMFRSYTVTMMIKDENGGNHSPNRYRDSVYQFLRHIYDIACVGVNNLDVVNRMIAIVHNRMNMLSYILCIKYVLYYLQKCHDQGGNEQTFRCRSTCGATSDDGGVDCCAFMSREALSWYCNVSAHFHTYPGGIPLSYDTVPSRCHSYLTRVNDHMYILSKCGSYNVNQIRYYVNYGYLSQYIKNLVYILTWYHRVTGYFNKHMVVVEYGTTSMAHCKTDLNCKIEPTYKSYCYVLQIVTYKSYCYVLQIVAGALGPSLNRCVHRSDRDATDSPSGFR